MTKIPSDILWHACADRLAELHPEYAPPFERLKAVVARYRNDNRLPRGVRICPCGSTRGLQKHHKFSQTDWARAVYGALLDDPRNIQWACAKCHPSHASPHLIRWSEVEFCAALGIEPRSKLAATTARLSRAGSEGGDLNAQ